MAYAITAKTTMGYTTNWVWTGTEWLSDRDASKDVYSTVFQTREAAENELKNAQAAWPAEWPVARNMGITEIYS